MAQKPHPTEIRSTNTSGLQCMEIPSDESNHTYAQR
jgi:hypothetical protein